MNTYVFRAWITAAILCTAGACSDDGVPLSSADDAAGTTGTDGSAPTGEATFTTTGSETQGSGTSDDPTASDASGPPDTATTDREDDGGDTDGLSDGTTGDGTTGDGTTGDGTTGDGTTGGESTDDGEAGMTTDGPGCADDGACEQTEYCVFPDGQCGKGALGTCETISDGFCPGIYAPVCGCDGTTYSNDCHAANAGVDVAHDGECS